MIFSFRFSKYIRSNERISSKIDADGGIDDRVVAVSEKPLSYFFIWGVDIFV